MAFKTGEEEEKVESRKDNGKKDDPKQGGDKGEGSISKSALDFRDERWKLTPTPANGNRLGDPLTYKVKVGFGTSAQLINVKTFVPAIARVGFIPTFGVSRDAGSPISTLASTLYAQILSALKRASLKFDPTAVAVHMLGMGSIYCAYDVAVRAYRALNTTDVDNAYLAKNLVEACGFDYEDLMANKPSLYFWFSTARATLQQYVVPKSFAMIGAHRAMCTNAYHDSPSAKSQLYVFTPDYLWSWEKVDTAGGLRAVSMRETPNGSDKLKFSTFVSKFNAMLQALINSTDFKDINASIRATYADSDVYTFDMPGVDDTLPMVIDEVVLNSLLNASTLGDLSIEGVNSFAPTDKEPNTFIITPHIPYTNQNLSRIVNSINDCPTSESMVSNMRWHVALDVDGTAATEASINVISCGTEVITRIRAHALNDDCPFIYANKLGTDSKILEFTIGGSNLQELQNQTDASTAIMKYVESDFSLILAQAFRWRPITCVTRYYSYENDPSNMDVPLYTVWSALATDWNYQTTVSDEDLIAWHTALLFSACSL